MAPNNVRCWQSNFAEMLPRIERQLKRQFRSLDPVSKEESTQEGIVHALLAYSRLAERGRAGIATAKTLAYYAARQVKNGRPAVGCMSCREPMSRYAQLRDSGIQRERWVDDLIQDKRGAAIVDVVATRLDCRAWFATLPQRMKRLAADLAQGFTTSEAARRHGVTAGRISQIRRELAASWARFQHDC
jgi:hypothetical protein